MKVTREQTSWMEGSMLCSALLIQGKCLEELVYELGDDGVKSAYGSFMETVESVWVVRKGELEIVEDAE